MSDTFQGGVCDKTSTRHLVYYGHTGETMERSMSQKKFRANDHDYEVPIRCLLNADCIDQNIHVFTRRSQAIRFTAVHNVAGNDSGAVSLDLKKCTGTTAIASGTTILGSTKYDCKGAANTPQSPALSATAASLVFEVGDRLAADFTGTVTTLAGLVGSVTFRPLDVV